MQRPVLSGSFLSRSRRRLTPELQPTGFTLFELMLVLAVLSVILAVTVPNILRIHRQQTLIGSADQVRSVASSARVHAIETGLVWQFRYEPGGHHFMVVPFEHETEVATPQALGGATASGLGRFSKAAGTLPSSVTFAAPSGFGTSTTTTMSSAALGGGQQISAAALAGLPDAAKLASVSWSGPVLFQPNGSASEAMVDLVDNRRQQITLHVRGITGGVSLSRLHDQRKK